MAAACGGNAVVCHEDTAGLALKLVTFCKTDVRSWHSGTAIESESLRTQPTAASAMAYKGATISCSRCTEAKTLGPPQDFCRESRSSGWSYGLPDLPDLLLSAVTGLVAVEARAAESKACSRLSVAQASQCSSLRDTASLAGLPPAVA